MPIQSDMVTAPAHWACYLINGDAGMMDDSDIAACDAFSARLGAWYIVDVARNENGDAIEARFSWHCRYYGATYSGGDLIDYMVHRESAPATLAAAAQALANC